MRRTDSRTLLVRALVMALALGQQASCTGNIDGDVGGAVVNPTAPQAPAAPVTGQTPASSTCTTPAVGPSPMRRLTAREYDNAVLELLGDATHPAETFPPDNRVGFFDNTATVQTVPVLLAEKYLDTAAKLAGDIKDVRAFASCTGSAIDASCVADFIARFGRRAYRRPLTATEIGSLQTLWNETTAHSNAETGVRGVVAALLVSPHFLFRPEFGAGPSAVAGAQQASPFELASRLAGLLWSSVPDDALLDAATRGELATREQVATQAKRLLADPRARLSTSSFYAQWLGAQLLATTTKDASLYPEFDEALRHAMQEESRRFIDYVVWEGDARSVTLLTAPFSFVNARLAKHYGIAGPADDATFMRVALDPTQRAGVLTQAGFLTALSSPTESSPFKRGAWVRRRLLCQELPDPPNNVPPLPKPQPGVSLRERASVHSSVAPCNGCHHLIDGLGFGLEQYDALGRVRTMEQGKPVDSSGEVTSTLSSDGPFDGGAQLAARLAASKEAQGCVATQWLRYALARPETQDDACSVAALQSAFAASGGDLKQLMVDLTQLDTFSSYRAPAEETAP
jgi:Protein of unknown function (DUF1592)/Protein of unknown function (DUF1588)/Protein of unknown function (DUF1595)/Protein of unknown function (DUF1587)/Protein of unknown function (DUF1585)